ncbi:MAG: hypothetical protein ABEH35_07265 [Haloarculaceae archaeon]
MTRAIRPRLAAVVVAVGGLAIAGWGIAVTALTVTTRIDAVAPAGATLLLLGLLGLALDCPWLRRSPAGEGAAITIVGTLVFALGQALATFGSSDLGTTIVFPGVLAMIVGTVLLATGLAREDHVPRKVVVALVVTALSLAGFNRGGFFVLATVPYGLAWTALGAVLVVDPGPLYGSGQTPDGEKDQDSPG